MRVYSLIYHDVVSRHVVSGFNSRPAGWYKLDPTRFARHLARIKAKLRQTSIRTDLLASDLDGATDGAQIGLLHFDDGGACAPAVADDLERHHLRGQFNIITSLIGKPAFISESAIRDLHQRGHLIASHSHHHPAMSRLSFAAQRFEWEVSLARLSDLIGKPVTVAALPGGFGSPRVERAAAAAGIRALFTSVPTAEVRRVGSCQVLGRFSIRRTTTARMAAALLSGDTRAAAFESVRWRATQGLLARGGERWLRVRRRLLTRMGQ